MLVRKIYWFGGWGCGVVCLWNLNLIFQCKHLYKTRKRYWNRHPLALTYLNPVHDLDFSASEGGKSIELFCLKYIRAGNPSFVSTFNTFIIFESNIHSFFTTHIKQQYFHNSFINLESQLIDLFCPRWF